MVAISKFLFDTDFSTTDEAARLAPRPDTRWFSALELDAAKAAAKQKNDAKLTQAAQDFEAMFITEMMKPMFEDIKPDAMFGGGKGEEIFQGFMLEEYGKMMAQTGQIGIADAVKAEMMRMQEGK